MYAQIKNPNNPATMKYVNAATHVFITTLRDADVDYTVELDEQQEEVVAYAVLDFVHNVLPLIQSPSYPLVVEIPAEDHPLRCTLMQSPMVTPKETIPGVVLMVEDKNGLILYQRMGGLSVIDMIDSLIQLETPPWMNNSGFNHIPAGHQQYPSPQGYGPTVQPYGFNPDIHYPGPMGVTTGTYFTEIGPRLAGPNLVDQYMVNGHITVKRYAQTNVIALAIPDVGTTPFNVYLPEKQDTGTVVVLLGDNEGNPETFIYIDVPMPLDANIFSDIKNSTDYTVDLNEGYRDHLEDTYEVSVNQLDPAAFHGAIVLTGDLLHGESSVLPKYFWHITKA